MSDLNETIRLMLGTSQAQAPDPVSPSIGQDMPSLQNIATNGKLLVENVSQIAQIIGEWK